MTTAPREITAKRRSSLVIVLHLAKKEKPVEWEPTDSLSATARTHAISDQDACRKEIRATVTTRVTQDSSVLK